MALFHLGASLKPRPTRLPVFSSHGRLLTAYVVRPSHKAATMRCGLRHYADAARPAETASPPDHLDDKEKAIFDTLRESLSPTALEVRAP